MVFTHILCVLFPFYSFVKCSFALFARNSEGRPLRRSAVRARPASESSSSSSSSCARILALGDYQACDGWVYADTAVEDFVVAVTQWIVEGTEDALVQTYVSFVYSGKRETDGGGILIVWGSVFVNEA